MLYLAHRGFCPQESAAARELLDLLCRRVLDAPAPPLLREPGGKPRFAREDLHCGIAHTRGHVFAALADGPVGLDAEDLSRPLRLETARRVLSPGEALPPGQERQGLLRYWTLKEAYLKYTGQGLRRDMRGLTFTLEPEPHLAGSDLHFAQLEAFGCLVALCADAPVLLKKEEILEL